jgi:hypothetical protein
MPNKQAWFSAELKPHCCLFFRHSAIGAGGLQGSDHLLDADFTGVISDSVNLAETLKSLGHFFNSRQPFQG